MTWQEIRDGEGEGRMIRRRKKKSKCILTTSDMLMSGLTWYLLGLKGLL